MRVYGEAFFIINGWMNFLCLLLAARLGRSHFYPVRAWFSASVGAVYGVLAWTAKQPFLRSVPALFAVYFGMAFTAFGKRCLRLFPLVVAAGWLLSGLSNFVSENGGIPMSVIWIDSGAALAVLWLIRRIGDNGGGRFRLRIEYRGKAAEVSALRDTGNLLADNLSGLPVIVLPERKARIFLTQDTDLKDLSTLPPGWRLLRVQTAAGSKVLMCFTPDQCILLQGTRVWRAEAVIAVSDFQESRALLPDSLFSDPWEEMCHADL